MFLRRAFLVFPSLVSGMTNVETDSPSGAIGFLASENHHPLVKTEKTSPNNPPENPSEGNEDASPNNVSASSSSIVESSGAGDDADAAASGPPETEPDIAPESARELAAEPVENTQPQTVTVDAIPMSGVSWGKFEVSSIRELREKVAAARGVPPVYIKLSSENVILQDNAPLQALLGREHVLVARVSSPEAILSPSVERWKALDRDHLGDRAVVQANRWNSLMEALNALFKESDNFSSDSDYRKCGKVVETVATKVTTTNRTPDCLRSRLRIFGAIWTAVREMSKIDGIVKLFKHASDPDDTFQNIVGDVRSADLSDVSLRTKFETIDGHRIQRTVEYYKEGDPGYKRMWLTFAPHLVGIFSYYGARGVSARSD